jgi:penicillin-insensitive murein endopeptidase
VAARPEPEPVAEVQVAAPEFERLMSERVTELGSLSIGAANRGFLFNAVQMPEGPLWEVVEPKYSWGTETTVRALSVAVKEVNRHYPETPRLFIGHLSRERGGWLRPHRSHQSGRDVDLGFFYLDGPNWYKQATPENLDVPRTWALLSALFKATPVEYAFVDRSLHPALREEATRIGESEHFLGEVFDGDVRVEPILRHARGHRDHMHVRFASPAAVDNARRAVAHLGAKARRWQTLRSMLEHRARQQKTD